MLNLSIPEPKELFASQREKQRVRDIFRHDMFPSWKRHDKFLQINYSELKLSTNDNKANDQMTVPTLYITHRHMYTKHHYIQKQAHPSKYT